MSVSSLLACNVNNIFFEKRIIAFDVQTKRYSPQRRWMNEKVFSGIRHTTSSTLLQKVYSLKKIFLPDSNLDGRDIAVGVRYHTDRPFTEIEAISFSL